MKMQWKLREKLTLLTLMAGLLPLLVAIVYVGHRSSVLLEQQSMNYLKAKVDGFKSMVEIRNDSIEGNLDIIKEQLKKNLKEELVKAAAREQYFDSGYLIIFTTDGQCVYHPRGEYMNNTLLYDTHDFIRRAVDQKEGFVRYTLEGERKMTYTAHVRGMDWILWGTVPEDEVLASVSMLKVQMYVFLLVISVIIAIVGFVFSRQIAKRAKDISGRMMDIARGDADLSVRLPILSRDEIGDIAHWFNEFVENLEEVITKVKNAAVQVDAATQEVAAGSDELSMATQQQASSIEEVAATIEEMTSSIKQNASNATKGREKAQQMVQMANTSGEASQQLVLAMSEISAASRKIGDIIVTVNEVAFQTNLLALNAAVEAARAGEHGKGFAVVAEEVRALAQRSAEAARQIKALIEDTVGKISAGDTMVKRSGESLEQIISHIEDLSVTMEEIAAASSEQAGGVDELNRAVSQIDTMTQQDASTVEELANTSNNLSREAKHLSETVARFKVSLQEHATSATGSKPHSRARVNAGPAASDFPDNDFEEF